MSTPIDAARSALRTSAFLAPLFALPVAAQADAWWVAASTIAIAGFWIFCLLWTSHLLGRWDRGLVGPALELAVPVFRALEHADRCEVSVTRHGDAREAISVRSEPAREET